MCRLLLFDMDHVLVAPEGYHQALVETVALVSRALGGPPLVLGREEVERFEACGVTSEWDSAAICGSLLLARALAREPAAALRLDGPLPPGDPGEDGAALQALRALLEELSREGASAAPRERAGELLLDQHRELDAVQREAVLALIRGARDAHASPTHRLFQELVLGSEAYAASYGLPPRLAVATGALLAHDRPGLLAEEQRRLRAWLERPGHGAASLTNRPSLDPDGAGSPEAEYGARVAGLETLPIVGLGALRWLAARRGAAADAFLKPSPVHAIAALLVAAGAPLAEALELAPGLAADGEGPADGHAQLRRLEGAEVWIFEDGLAGLESARGAASCLARRGLRLELHLCGVTPSAVKAAPLAAAGASVAPELAAALRALPGWGSDGVEGPG